MSGDFDFIGGHYLQGITPDEVIIGVPFTERVRGGAGAHGRARHVQPPQPRAGRVPRPTSLVRGTSTSSATSPGPTASARPSIRPPRSPGRSDRPVLRCRVDRLDPGPRTLGGRARRAVQAVRTARVAGGRGRRRSRAGAGRGGRRRASLLGDFPDVLMIQDLYQFKPPLPFSPGRRGRRGGARGRRRGSTHGRGRRPRASRRPAGAAWPSRSRCRRLRASPCPRASTSKPQSAFLYAYGTVALRARRTGPRCKPGETPARARRGRRRRAGRGRARAPPWGPRSSPPRRATSKLAAVPRARRGHDDQLRSRGPQGAVARAHRRQRRRRRLRPGRRSLQRARPPLDGVGRAASSSSASPPATSPRSRSTCRCSRGARSSASSGAPSCSASPTATAANVAELVAMWEDGRLQPHVSATFPLERAVEAIRSWPTARPRAGSSSPSAPDGRSASSGR